MPLILNLKLSVLPFLSIGKAYLTEHLILTQLCILSFYKYNEYEHFSIITISNKNDILKCEGTNQVLKTLITVIIFCRGT